MNPKRLVIVVPSLKAGGMERVASVLANHFGQKNHLNIYMINLTLHKIDYKLHANVKFYQPEFNSSNISFLSASVKSIFYLRSLFKEITPDAIISFGDRYNSLTILASLGLNLRVFVSNRMAPSMSNGLFIDLLNKIFYPFANGIIAQTEYARSVFLNRYRNNKIAAIPNPFLIPNRPHQARDKIIINVGRFGDKKNQHLLVNYFNDLSTNGWQLIFFGDGLKIDLTNEAINKIREEKLVELKGVVENLDIYYQKAAIFAFTSFSEGFPNALGEAMAAGCACISFDCEAGPSELIDEGVNGFLVPVGDHDEYKRKLQLLIDDEELRKTFGVKAREKIKQFEVEKIAWEYLDFIIPEHKSDSSH